MSTNCVVGHCTEGPVKLLGVSFGPDLQMNKNLWEVTSRETILT